jgi:hypothetical protein
MAANEIFESASRPSGDLAGVFEHDGETGYFYLYETKADEGQKIVAAIQVVIGCPDFKQEDVTVQWDVSERMVGLFIRERLWAAFDAELRVKYGGSYRANSQPSIPTEIVRLFEPR